MGESVLTLDDIRTALVGHFARLFTSKQNVPEAVHFPEAVRAFCGALPLVPDHLVEGLTTPATCEEV